MLNDYALSTVCFIVILSMLAQGILCLCNGQDSAHGLCQKGTIDASEAAQVVKYDMGVLWP